MACEADVWRFASDPGVKVVDIGGTRFTESDAVGFEAGAFQEFFQNTERAGIDRSYRAAANEIAGNRQSISHVSA
jgi:hypothetical protein